MILSFVLSFFFFSSRRRHTRYWRDWSSDVCSSDLRRRGLRADRAGAGDHRVPGGLRDPGSGVPARRQSDDTPRRRAGRAARDEPVLPVATVSRREMGARKRILRWAGWFAVANAVLLMVVGLRYLWYYSALTPSPAWIY